MQTVGNVGRDLHGRGIGDFGFLPLVRKTVINLYQKDIYAKMVWFHNTFSGEG